MTQRWFSATGAVLFEDGEGWRCQRCDGTGWVSERNIWQPSFMSERADANSEAAGVPCPNCTELRNGWPLEGAEESMTTSELTALIRHNLNMADNMLVFPAALSMATQQSERERIEDAIKYIERALQLAKEPISA